MSTAKDPISDKHLPLTRQLSQPCSRIEEDDVDVSFERNPAVERRSASYEEELEDRVRQLTSEVQTLELRLSVERQKRREMADRLVAQEENYRTMMDSLNAEYEQRLERLKNRTKVLNGRCEQLRTERSRLQDTVAQLEAEVVIKQTEFEMKLTNIRNELEKIKLVGGEVENHREPASTLDSLATSKHEGDVVDLSGLKTSLRDRNCSDCRLQACSSGEDLWCSLYRMLSDLATKKLRYFEETTAYGVGESRVMKIGRSSQKPHTNLRQCNSWPASERPTVVRNADEDCTEVGLDGDLGVPVNNDDVVDEVATQDDEPSRTSDSCSQPLANSTLCSDAFKHLRRPKPRRLEQFSANSIDASSLPDSMASLPPSPTDRDTRTMRSLVAGDRSTVGVDWLVDAVSIVSSTSGSRPTSMHEPLSNSRDLNQRTTTMAFGEIPRRKNKKFTKAAINSKRHPSLPRLDIFRKFQSSVKSEKRNSSTVDVRQATDAEASTAPVSTSQPFADDFTIDTRQLTEFGQSLNVSYSSTNDGTTHQNGDFMTSVEPVKCRPKSEVSPRTLWRSRTVNPASTFERLNLRRNGVIDSVDMRHLRLASQSKLDQLTHNIKSYLNNNNQ